MAEPIYLNYGQNQIDLLAFLEAVANNVLDYVALQPWSNKRKQLFMQAYSDIMSRGVSGANNSSGTWAVNYNNGLIDLESKSKKEQEMYGEAAYFIRKLMDSITPKAVEDLKKEELPIFDNEQFNKGLENYISNNLYRGMNFELSKWNERDSVNEYGIRDTTERAKMLARVLRDYANSIDSSKFSFEGSPYKDIDTLKNDLNIAASALESGNWDNDTLYKIGIDPEQYLATGINETVTTVDGKLMRRGDVPGYYLKLKDEQLKEKQKAEALILKQKREAARKNLYKGMRYYDASKLVGKSLSQIPDLTTLSSYSNLGTLNGEQQSLLVGAFRAAERNNMLSPLDREEITKFGNRYNPRYRKIKGLDGFYWDPAGQRIIKPLTESTNSFQSLLDLNKPEALAEQKNKLANVNMDTAIKDIPGLSTEMKKEIWATGLDIASVVDPEAFSGSILGVKAAMLRDEADPNRSTFDKWLDYGTGALGGIQVIGDLALTGKAGYHIYKLGKLINGSTKIAGAIGAVFALHGVPEAKDSIMKLATDWRSVTPRDVLNIAYGFMAIMGIKAFTKARNKLTIEKASNPTIKEHYIEIKDANGTHEVKIDEGLANEINQSRERFGKKVKEDKKILDNTKVKEAIEKYNDSHPESKIDLNSASIAHSNFWNSRSKIAAKSKDVRDPNAPEYEPIGETYGNFGYLLPWQRNVWKKLSPEGKGIFERLRDFWSPEPKIKKQGENSNTGKEGASSEPKETNKKKTWEEISKEGSKWKMSSEAKEIKEILKNPGKNIISEESFKVGDFSFSANRNPGSLESGTLSISVGGSAIPDIKFESRKHLRQQVLKFLKDNKIKISLPDGLKKVNMKETARLLKELKAHGFLKYGGTIDKKRIQRYKQFIKK